MQLRQAIDGTGLTTARHLRELLAARTRRRRGEDSMTDDYFTELAAAQLAGQDQLGVLICARSTRLGR